MKLSARAIANRLLGTVGVRAVNAAWGPRGFAGALSRASRLGVHIDEIVDVGAASGEWTRECMAVLPNARYFLVDPLDENAVALRTLAAARRNVHCWIGALGASQGTMQLFVHGDQSSAYPSEFSRVPGRDVSVRTLDSFLGREIHHPALIKADVQGHELEVLQGAERCLSTAVLVLLEVSFRRIYAGAPLAHEVIAFMGARGFRILDVCTYTQSPSDGELAQSDLLFARDGAPIFSREGYA